MTTTLTSPPPPLPLPPSAPPPQVDSEKRSPRSSALKTYEVVWLAARVAHSATRIRSLSLQAAGLTNDRLWRLLKAIHHCPTLEHLDLRRNKRLVDPKYVHYKHSRRAGSSLGSSTTQSDGGSVASGITTLTGRRGQPSGFSPQPGMQDVDVGSVITMDDEPPDLSMSEDLVAYLAGNAAAPPGCIPEFLAQMVVVHPNLETVCGINVQKILQNKVGRGVCASGASPLPTHRPFSPQAKTLQLAYHQLGPFELAFLAHVLRRNESVSSLDLSMNHVAGLEKSHRGEEEYCGDGLAALNGVWV